MPETNQPDSGARSEPASGGRLRSLAFSRPVLLFAFAFAVMADPVSSVAYAIEAALRALDGDLGLLLPTMGLVVAVIALIIVNYHELIGRFPQGGGAAAAAGSAFGEAWAFIPIGALIVDFVLTIAISVSAASSALIAFASGLAPLRIPLALVILLIVAGLTWFGHIGRAVFAAMTTVFVVVAVFVLVGGFGSAAARPPIDVSPGHSPLIAVLLAFPVAMALATGVEAPSSAIAQLGQLDDRGRKLFGRVTIWLTLLIVGSLTLGLTALAVHLNVGIPHPDQTQISEVAKASVGDRLYTTFQIVTALLLLAAASSSFQAGPGLLKALARRTRAGGDSTGILHSRLAVVNEHHTPYVAVGVFVVASAAVVAAAGAKDQELVLFYAVSVFLSFLAGLLAMARFARREGRRFSMAVSLLGAVVVTFTLAINLSRGDPIASLAASLAIAGVLYRMWIRAGRPRGIATAVSEAEQ
ncbi:MAG TPA: amino acid permease [Solirubrobacterales bacterium]|jgi:amino acid transporter|nr:amino acid permease [Solirubrobacterales bacterium]